LFEKSLKQNSQNQTLVANVDNAVEVEAYTAEFDEGDDGNSGNECMMKVMMLMMMMKVSN
jgi:hypothetical protein